MKPEVRINLNVVIDPSGAYEESGEAALNRSLAALRSALDAHFPGCLPPVWKDEPAPMGQLSDEGEEHEEDCCCPICRPDLISFKSGEERQRHEQILRDHCDRLGVTVEAYMREQSGEDEDASAPVYEQRSKGELGVPFVRDSSTGEELSLPQAVELLNTLTHSAATAYEAGLRAQRRLEVAQQKLIEELTEKRSGLLLQVHLDKRRFSIIYAGPARNDAEVLARVDKILCDTYGPKAQAHAEAEYQRGLAEGEAAAKQRVDYSKLDGWKAGYEQGWREAGGEPRAEEEE